MSDQRTAGGRRGALVGGAVLVLVAAVAGGFLVLRRELGPRLRATRPSDSTLEGAQCSQSFLWVSRPHQTIPALAAALQIPLPEEIRWPVARELLVGGDSRGIDAFRISLAPLALLLEPVRAMGTRSSRRSKQSIDAARVAAPDAAPDARSDTESRSVGPGPAGGDSRRQNGSLPPARDWLRFLTTGSTRAQSSCGSGAGDLPPEIGDHAWVALLGVTRERAAGETFGVPRPVLGLFEERGVVRWRVLGGGAASSALAGETGLAGGQRMAPTTSPPPDRVALAVRRTSSRGENLLLWSAPALREPGVLRIPSLAVAECAPVDPESDVAAAPREGPSLPPLGLPRWIEVRERGGEVGGCLYRATDADAERAIREWTENLAVARQERSHIPLPTSNVAGSLGSDAALQSHPEETLEWWAHAGHLASALLAAREGTTDLGARLAGGDWLPGWARAIPSEVLEDLEQSGGGVRGWGSPTQGTVVRAGDR